MASLIVSMVYCCEERVAPGDEVVEVGHDRFQHVGGGAVLRHGPGLEGVLHPGIDAGHGLLIEDWGSCCVERLARMSWIISTSVDWKGRTFQKRCGVGPGAVVGRD